MRSIFELAEEILSREQPLHVTEIAKRAIVIHPSIGDDEKQVAAKISSSLSGHITRNHNKKSAIFRRIPNGKKNAKGKSIYFAGQYGLKQKKKPSPASPPKKLDTPVSTTFIGKAGEYGVFSELLYWGYNPAMMVVDHGIDIIASIDNQFFNIQVKTGNPNASNSFTYTIDKKVFERHENSKTFYVFVVRKTIKERQISDYIIMPSSEVRRLISLEHINVGTRFSLNITVNGNSFNIKRKHAIADVYVNNFSIIR